METRKEEIITFKVDSGLAEKLRSVPNRSEFIRQAVLLHLGNECPFCHGTGTLTAHQMAHLQTFLEHHEMQQCDECGETHLVCENGHEA
ncbi:ribbon-helix-helix domain-containing protein [Spirochaeta dissipatitropha]